MTKKGTISLRSTVSPLALICTVSFLWNFVFFLALGVALWHVSSTFEGLMLWYGRLWAATIGLLAVLSLYLAWWTRPRVQHGFCSFFLPSEIGVEYLGDQFELIAMREADGTPPWRINPLKARAMLTAFCLVPSVLIRRLTLPIRTFLNL